MTGMKGQESASQEELLRRVRDLERENQHLKSLLLTDELTGLYNKRFFYIQLEVETSRTRRTGQPCALLVMDMDDFKSINDAFGHGTGDRVLCELGGLIWKNIRPTDFACRFGGDEFGIIMPGANLSESIGVAKRIQRSLAKPQAGQYPEIGKRLSASFGLAAYEPFSQLSVDDFFQQADSEMYVAKKAGKNQIACGNFRRMEKVAVSEAEREALSQIMTPLPSAQEQQ